MTTNNEATMVTLVCGKCDGTGVLPHYAHIEQGLCFQCGGTGKGRKGQKIPSEPAHTMDSLRAAFASFRREFHRYGNDNNSRYACIKDALFQVAANDADLTRKVLEAVAAVNKHSAWMVARGLCEFRFWRKLSPAVQALALEWSESPNPWRWGRDRMQPVNTAGEFIDGK